MTHKCHDCGTTLDVKLYFCRGCEKKTLGHFASICMECCNKKRDMEKRDEKKWQSTGYNWQARPHVG